MTPPLTPHDCDLRDFSRMMIDITRLRQSDFDAIPDDGAWRAGLNLWFSAWHAVPAGSLADDDAALAKAAGLGRDLKTWRGVKDAALRGFVRCDDGRLYHTTVCEFALEAWIEKLVQRIASGTGNAKRWSGTFDPAPVERAIQDAVTRLASLAPNSKSLAKAHRRLTRTQLPQDSARDPGATADGSPGGITDASRSEAERVPSGSLETGTGTGTGTVEEGSSINEEPHKSLSREELIPSLNTSTVGALPAVVANDLATAKPPKGDLTMDERVAFDAWWQLVPYKVGRKTAEPAFAKVYRSNVVSMDELAEATVLYGQWLMAWEGAGSPRTPLHPTTYLNQERWNDQLKWPSLVANSPRGQWSSMDEHLASIGFKE